MRVVLDANVLVSAAISDGPSHRIVQGWHRDETFELVVCDRLLGEVRSVLTERAAHEEVDVDRGRRTVRRHVGHDG